MINPPEFEIIELFEKEVAKKENDCFSNVFRLNIKGNKLLTYRLSDFMKEHYKDRLYSILDYRQMMLAFVLECVDGSECERLIQKLLPERLSSFLSNQEEFSCFFHDEINGQKRCNRLVIKRLGNSATDAFVGIESDVPEPNIPKGYQVGGKIILLVGNNDPEVVRLLGNKYELIQADTYDAAIKILTSDYDKITVILTGCAISEQDVRKLLTRVNSDNLFKPIPVMTTVQPEWEGNESDYFQLGTFELILFPYHYDVLLYRIGGVIEFRESKEMLQLMERDSITKLYTREFFLQYANSKIKCNPNKKYEYLSIEIENYQILLEKYGRVVFDIALTHITQTLLSSIPNIIFAGRMGEEQFAILREDIEFNDYESVALSIKEVGPVANLLIKIGAAKTEPNISIQTLTKNAEIALTKIKQQYGKAYALYDSEMQFEKLKELRILSSMEAALEKGQFSIYYQPKFEAATGKICGAEALVRWMHPEYGFMNPADFIPLFEKVGFICGLDRQIFARVCQDIVRWRAMGFRPIPISINLSRRDFETPDLADWILNLINTMHIPAELIHIEVTETAYSYNPERITSCIEKLHKNGIIIELDDFGVGYSSITMINKLHIDILKIDKEIVMQDRCDGTRSILDFCVELAKVAGYKTVVEGIEDEKHLNRVKKLGCNYVQGFLYSKPIPVGEFEIFWRRHK